MAGWQAVAAELIGRFRLAGGVVIGVVTFALLAACATPPLGAQPDGSDESGGAPIVSPGGSGSIDPITGSDPVELINMWRVTAPGEPEDTWLRLDAFGYEVWRQNNSPLGGSWDADDVNIVFSPIFMAGSAEEMTQGLPWLTSAVGYAPTDDGWALVDAAGNVTATLRIEGIPPANPNVWDQGRQPPEVTDDIRAQLVEPPALPTGFRAPEPDELVGYWAPIQTFSTHPFAEFFASEGDQPPRWTGSDGCNGVGGVWRLGENGRLLATSGAMTAIGCEGVPMEQWIAWGIGRVGFDRDELVTFDRSGAEVGRLVRSGPPEIPTEIPPGNYSVGIEELLPGEGDVQAVSFRILGTAVVTDDNIISLNAGCNTITVPIDGNTIGLAAATRMMCPDMENENALIAALNEAHNAAGGVIEIRSQNFFLIGSLQFSAENSADGLPPFPIVADPETQQQARDILDTVNPPTTPRP